MKSNNILWGILLIVIGVLLLLAKLDIFHIEFRTFWKLWPLLLIYFGISTLLKNQKQIAAVSASLVIIGLGAVIYFSMLKKSDKTNSQFEWRIEDDEQVDNKKSKKKKRFEFDESIPDSIEKGELKIKYGAGELNLKGSKKPVLNVVANTIGENFILEPKVEGTEAIFEFSNNANKIGRNTMSANSADFLLYSQIPWSIEADMGASSARFDLSDLIVNKASFQIGASSFWLKLSNKAPQSEINISSGAASLELKIPKNANCVINLKSGLSAKNINGFTKKDDNTWVSQNFNNQIDELLTINLEIGLADLNISTY